MKVISLSAAQITENEDLGRTRPEEFQICHKITEEKMNSRQKFHKPKRLQDRFFKKQKQSDQAKNSEKQIKNLDDGKQKLGFCPRLCKALLCHCLHPTPLSAGKM